MFKTTYKIFSNYIVIDFYDYHHDFWIATYSSKNGNYSSNRFDLNQEVFKYLKTLGLKVNKK